MSDMLDSIEVGPLHEPVLGKRQMGDRVGVVGEQLDLGGICCDRTVLLEEQAAKQEQALAGLGSVVDVTPWQATARPGL